MGEWLTEEGRREIRGMRDKIEMELLDPDDALDPVKRKILYAKSNLLSRLLGEVM